MAVAQKTGTKMGCPGKWKHGPKLAQPLLFNFEPPPFWGYPIFDHRQLSPSLTSASSVGLWLSGAVPPGLGQKGFEGRDQIAHRPLRLRRRTWSMWSPGHRKTRKKRSPPHTNMAVGQNQWYHFGAFGAPPILEPILAGIESDVHWGRTDLAFDPQPDTKQPAWMAPMRMGSGCDFPEPLPRPLSA